MYLTDHKQHEEGSRKRIIQCLVVFKAFSECSSDERIIYKMSISGMVVLHLENAGIFVGTSSHHHAMPVLKDVNQIIRGGRCTPHLPTAGHNLKGSKDVMGICIAGW